MPRLTPARPIPADDRPLRTPRPQRGPRSRAILNLPGLCPRCGAAAVRRLTVARQERRETYRCALDGETTYLTNGDARQVIASQIAGAPLPAPGLRLTAVAASPGIAAP